MLKVKQFDFTVLSKFRTEIMGFAMLWIVIFHSSIPCSENILFKTLWYLFVSFGGGIGVNIFLLMSGYGLMFSNNKNSCCASIGDFLNYIKKRLKRICIPYIIVASIYFAFISNSIFSFIKKLTLVSFFMEGDRTYWYIAAILILYLIFPLYMKCTNKIGHKKILLISLLSFLIIEIFTNLFLPHIYERLEIIILRMPLFFIGAYLGQLSLDNEEKPNNVVKIISIVIIIFSIVAFCLMFVLGTLSSRGQRYLFIPISVFVIVFLAFLFKKFGKKLTLLTFLGKHSLGIYLIHIPLYELFNHFFVDILNPYVVFITVLIASMILAYVLSLIVSLINKLISK